MCEGGIFCAPCISDVCEECVLCVSVVYAACVQWVRIFYAGCSNVSGLHTAYACMNIFSHFVVIKSFGVTKSVKIILSGEIET